MANKNVKPQPDDYKMKPLGEMTATPEVQKSKQKKGKPTSEK